ncbi:hypothetical protein EVAR_25360_1 [Eumeta japonica]|uniref:Uncharacterized protein n=1 Tax=Eumeta variegata TaxID=151549 RepID=A0A4C1XZ37_EUMVA|nr:hypothetical protein EVAR_25360_1 [Eumeta japonica]
MREIKDEEPEVPNNERHEVHSNILYALHSPCCAHFLNICCFPSCFHRPRGSGRQSTGGADTGRRDAEVIPFRESDHLREVRAFNAEGQLQRAKDLVPPARAGDRHVCGRLRALQADRLTTNLTAVAGFATFQFETYMTILHGVKSENFVAWLTDFIILVLAQDTANEREESSCDSCGVVYLRSKCGVTKLFPRIFMNIRRFAES